MFKIITKKISLLTLSLLLHPANIGATLYLPTKKGIEKISSHLEYFFSKNDMKSYNEHLNNIELALKELDSIINNLIRKDNSKYTKEICTLAKIVQCNLSKILTVLKKYRHSEPNNAFKLASEIKNTCNVAELFTNIKNHLTKLIRVAQKENNKAMISNLESLKNALENIDNTWKYTGNSTLLTGLMHRMRQK